MRKFLLMLVLITSLTATAGAATKTYTDTIYFSFDSTDMKTATNPPGRIWKTGSNPGVISFLTGLGDLISYQHYHLLPTGSTVTEAHIILTLRQNDDAPEGAVVSLSDRDNGWYIVPIDRGSNDYTAHVNASYLTKNQGYGLIVTPQVLYGDFAIDKSVLSITYEEPVIQVTPTSLNFGYVPIGTTKNLTLTVKNTGGGTLTGSAYTTAPFGISSGRSYSLGADQSQVITISYQPTSSGPHTGTVLLQSGGNATVQVGGKTDASLYFPHVATTSGWQTEIAIINTSPNQSVTGTLRAMNSTGQLVDTKPVTLSARGRRQITVANEFTNNTDIGYIIFDTDSDMVQGYTQFYIEGCYRTVIPAVKELNISDIYISHIASDAQWWTGISLVNTTASTKVLTITFNDSQSREITLHANEHKAFDIASLFNNQPQPNIRSAKITNVNGIIGLELFGGSNLLDGILLTDKTASTIYYPHVAIGEWWTGIVAYNPSESACTMTITPYKIDGIFLSSQDRSIAARGKYVGTVAALGLPAETAWFRIDSTLPLSGFELFGTVDGQQLAPYSGGGGTGAKAGVFAKIEKNGWTGIVFVNTEATDGSVFMWAINDNGDVVAHNLVFNGGSIPSGLSIGSHAKVVRAVEEFFSQDISSATYIVYSSDRNVVGFQLNGSTDGTMLDGLPGL